MQEPNQEPKQTITVPVGPKLIIFACILLGLLFLMLGNWINVEALRQLGAFILPAAFLYGGFYLKEDGAGIRITLLAVGGYLAVSGLLGIAFLT